MRQQFDQVPSRVENAAKDYLRGLSPVKFVDELAEAWGELNVVHSFREGNTRRQFVFFSQLAEQADYQIDTAAFAPGSPLCDEFVQARFHSQDKASNDWLDVEQQWQDLFTERSQNRTAGDAHSW